jgi:hypothetical protein
MAAKGGILVVAVLVIAALSAPAARAEVSRRQIREAKEVAAKLTRDPCAGEVAVRSWRLRRDTLAIARWDGMWDVPSDERTGCEVILNRRKSWTYAKLCTALVHEYGHLAGRRHGEGTAMSARYYAPHPRCD